MISRIALVALAVVLIPTAASAASVDVTAENLTGFRSTPEGSGLYAQDGWTEENGGFRIAWVICQDVDSGNWTYKYTMSSNTASTDPLDVDGLANLVKEVSHMDLEVSASFVELDFISTSGAITFRLQDPEATFFEDHGHPGLPAEFVNAISIEDFTFGSGDPWIIEIVTPEERNPVWGDFYAKDGKVDGVDAIAYSTGFGTDPTAGNSDDFSNFTAWIPTPNGDTGGGVIIFVPEPASFTVWGLGLLGMVTYRRRQRRREAA